MGRQLPENRLTPRTMQISLETPVQPAVVTLIDELDAYQRALYPLSVFMEKRAGSR